MDKSSYWRHRAKLFLRNAKAAFRASMRGVNVFEAEDDRQRKDREEELAQMYEHVKALVRRVEDERGWGRGEGADVTDEELERLRGHFLIIEHEENLRRLKVSEEDPRSEGEGR